MSSVYRAIELKASINHGSKLAQSLAQPSPSSVGKLKPSTVLRPTTFLFLCFSCEDFDYWKKKSDSPLDRLIGSKYEEVD